MDFFSLFFSCLMLGKDHWILFWPPDICNIKVVSKVQDFKISRFIWKHSDTYTSVTRGHFLNNIYIQDITEWTYDEK
jgi:hypothetical protein